MAKGYKNHPNNVCRKVVKLILGKSFLRKPALAVQMDVAGSVEFITKDGDIFGTATVTPGFAKGLLGAVSATFGLPDITLAVFTPDGRATVLF